MILGIDYGLKNIGTANSEGSFASPYITFYQKAKENGVNKILEVVLKLGISEIVIGITEGKMKNNILNFGNKVKELTNLPIHYVDESLSTIETKFLTTKKQDDHSQSAAIILQRYLDDHPKSD